MSGWPFDPNHDAPTRPRDDAAPAPARDPDAEAAQIELATARRRASANRSLIVGAILLAVGLLITVGTYTSAASSRGGGTYLVAWGPMLVGLIRIVRGLSAR